MATSLRNSGKGNPKRPRAEAGSPTSPEVSLLPSIRMLLEQQTEKFDERFSSFEASLKEQVKQIETQFGEVKEAIAFQSKELEETKEKLKMMEAKVVEKEAALQVEIDKLSAYVARENLIFMGLPEKEGEDIKAVMKDFYINALKLSEEDANKIEYQRVHRIATKSTPRPIKARFVRYVDRENIMRNAKNLKGTKLSIREDIPMRMRMARQAQMPVLFAARRVGKLAYFSRSEPTKLFVDKVWMPVAKQKNFMESLPGEHMEGQN